MPGLTRDQIRSAPTVPLKTARVPMPEWTPPGGKPEDSYVTVRQFRGADTDAIAALAEPDARGGRTRRRSFRAQMIIRACYTDDGQRLFNQDDADWLTLQPVTATNRIVAALTELNGGEDLEADLSENFDDDPSDGSPSS